MDRKTIKADARDAIRGSNWVMFSLSHIIWGFILSCITAVGGIIISVGSGALSKIPAARTLFMIVFGICLYIIVFGFMGTVMVAAYKNALEVWNGMSVDLMQITKYTKYLMGNGGCLWAFIWRSAVPIPFLNIYLMFKYMLIFMVKADNPYMKTKFCKKRCRELIKNHIFDLIIFQLSFFLWGLLCVVTCGLATFYVLPYQCVALAGFYETLKEGCETSDDVIP